MTDSRAVMTLRLRTAVSLGALLVAVGVFFSAASGQLQRAPQVPPGQQVVPDLRNVGPRPVGATLPEGTVPFFDTALHLTVDGLTPGTQAVLDQVQSNYCFVLRPRVTYGPNTAGKDGRVVFTRLGWATRSGACHITGRVSAATKLSLVRDLDFGTAQVAEPARYTVGRTWRMRDRLAFRSFGGSGTCEGDSLGPLHSFPVGIRQSGEDISLVIHGGPIGTDCQFVSQAVRLPAGMMLVSTTWTKSSSQSGCGNVGPLGGGATPLFASTPDLNRGTAPIIINEIRESSTPWYSLVSADQPVVTRDNVILLQENRTLVSFLLPMWTRLQCGVAPHNEDRIRLTLTELVFLGPPGLSFP